jgi:hypothetical protein
MTPTYYDTDEKRAALLAEARRWLGTPFHEMSAAPGPGGGVCCHLLAARLYINTGAVDAFAPPRPTLYRFFANPGEAVLDYMDRELPGRFAECGMWIAECGMRELPLRPATGAEAPSVIPHSAIRIPHSPLAGDLLAFREGNHIRHLAVVVENAGIPRFIHVLRHAGCCLRLLAGPYAEKLAAIRRPLPRPPTSRL